MSFTDWARDTCRRYRENSLRTATRVSASELAIGAGRRAGRRWNYGRNVWDYDWDLLILLDACRADLFSEVAPEYDWLPDDPGATYSAASMSREWMERHFTDGYRSETSRTALLSGNVFTQEDWVTPEKFAHFDEVWKHSWDDELGTVPARAVTDATIDAFRNTQTADRTIAWYLQPHNPFIGADWSDGWDSNTIGDWSQHGKSVWQRYRDGEIPKHELWDAYKDNLRYALDDVEILLENVDAERVVITSDHANCLGERGIFGHPPYVPDPALKRVPWVETSATDQESHVVETREPDANQVSDEASDRLEALGYA